MSLLNGRHSLTVWPATVGAPDRYGRKVHAGEHPTLVMANVQFVSSEEKADLGLEAYTVCRVLATEWPGGPYSVIEWEGRRFEQHGEALRFDRSTATAHFEVVMVAQTAETK